MSPRTIYSVACQGETWRSNFAHTKLLKIGRVRVSDCKGCYDPWALHGPQARSTQASGFKPGKRSTKLGDPMIRLVLLVTPKGAILNFTVQHCTAAQSCPTVVLPFEALPVDFEIQKKSCSQWESNILLDQIFLKNIHYFLAHFLARRRSQWDLRFEPKMVSYWQGREILWPQIERFKAGARAHSVSPQ